MTSVEDVDRQARALLAERDTPRRRARPRVGRALAEAEEHNLPIASGEIAAWRLGEGPAVLFVHGWEDDNALWGPAIDLFAQWGRPSVAIDLPGHGLSTASDPSMRSAGEAVRAAADGLGPIEAVIGHSYGCGAIIQALSHGLAVRKAVLISSPVPRTRPRKPLDGVEDIDPAVVARAEELRQARAVGQTEKIEAAIAAMTTPCLIVHSIDDEQTPLSNSQRLAQLWPGAELFLADQLGHRFVAQDGDVLDHIVRWVEG
jgi:pimeloyl-ACP methyl ester carboxylesterase